VRRRRFYSAFLQIFFTFHYLGKKRKKRKEKKKEERSRKKEKKNGQYGRTIVFHTLSLGRAAWQRSHDPL